MSQSIEIQSRWTRRNRELRRHGSLLFRRSTHLQTRAGWESRRGLTLVEIAITLSILVAAILGFSQALLDSMVSTRVNREMSVATDAARKILSDLQGVDFDQVFALHNSGQGPTLLGGTTITNGGFAVQGLNVVPGDADGLVGRLLFPEGDVGGAIELREDSADARFGTPRDLNGDGVLGDALDHSGDYKILPVVISLDWNGAAGPAHMEFKTVLAGF